MDKRLFYERHFGAPRFARYLGAARDDAAVAAELYDWNVALSAELWRALAYFEVAFRNAIDRAMTARHQRLGRAGHWIFDDARELGRDGHGPGAHRRPYVDVDQAKKRVRRNRKDLDVGQVISELPFGFWHQMISRRQRALWPDIASAFGNAPDRRQATVHEPIRRIREIRNRVGHHHRIWGHHVEKCYLDILSVAAYIDPALSRFVDKRCRVMEVLDDGRGAPRVEHGVTRFEPDTNGGE